jgi:uncharacterized protein YcbK (DUF882 family)
MKATGVKLSEHFVDTEFSCKHSWEAVDNGLVQCKDDLGKDGISAKLINALEELRTYLNTNLPDNHYVILRITSGFRCWDYNAFVEKQAYGRVLQKPKHPLGIAADVAGYEYQGNILIKKIPPKIMYDWLDANANRLSVGGIGLYKSWIHADCGSKGRRW